MPNIAYCAFSVAKYVMNTDFFKTEAHVSRMKEQQKRNLSAT